ncbi:MAG: hypothetical protein IT429_04100 [Gemmataceae bacterium]|nr:hypothetical protein [Gemmataceae bacterium]
MIWFACKQCGKKHSRPASSIGTMIFCECGQGNSVPWESTTEPPPVAPIPDPLPTMPAPRLEPIPIGEERVPSADRPRPARRPPGPRRRDPRFCFNHDDVASFRPCAACGEAFCGECVVEFQGATLCGPCKNFRVHTLQKPPGVSGKAVSSVLVTSFTWLFGIYLTLLALQAGLQVVGLVVVLAHLVALVLGALALRDTETNPRVSGRSLAVTGVVAGGAGVVLMLLLTLFPPSLG